MPVQERKASAQGASGVVPGQQLQALTVQCAAHGRQGGVGIGGDRRGRQVDRSDGSHPARSHLTVHEFATRVLTRQRTRNEQRRGLVQRGRRANHGTGPGGRPSRGATQLGNREPLRVTQGTPRLESRARARGQQPLLPHPVHALGDPLGLSQADDGALPRIPRDLAVRAARHENTVHITGVHHAGFSSGTVLPGDSFQPGDLPRPPCGLRSPARTQPPHQGGNVCGGDASAVGDGGNDLRGGTPSHESGAVQQGPAPPGLHRHSDQNATEVGGATVFRDGTQAQ